MDIVVAQETLPNIRIRGFFSSKDEKEKFPLIGSTGQYKEITGKEEYCRIPTLNSRVKTNFCDMSKGEDEI